MTAPATRKPCARSATAPCATSASLRAWSKRHGLPSVAVLLEKEPACDRRLLRPRVVFHEIMVQLRARGAPAAKLDAFVMHHGADAHFVEHAAVPFAATAVELLERDERVGRKEGLPEDLLHRRPAVLVGRLAP